MPATQSAPTSARRDPAEEKILIDAELSDIRSVLFMLEEVFTSVAPGQDGGPDLSEAAPGLAIVASWIGEKIDDVNNRMAAALSGGAR